jgi:hypothetical protein
VAVLVHNEAAAEEEEMDVVGVAVVVAVVVGAAAVGKGANLFPALVVGAQTDQREGEKGQPPSDVGRPHTQEGARAGTGLKGTTQADHFEEEDSPAVVVVAVVVVVVGSHHYIVHH